MVQYKITEYNIPCRSRQNTLSMPCKKGRKLVDIVSYIQGIFDSTNEWPMIFRKIRTLLWYFLLILLPIFISERASFWPFFRQDLLTDLRQEHLLQRRARLPGGCQQQWSDRHSRSYLCRDTWDARRIYRRWWRRFAKRSSLAGQGWWRPAMGPSLCTCCYPLIG